MQMMLQQMLDISKGCHTEGMDWGGKKKRMERYLWNLEML